MEKVLWSKPEHERAGTPLLLLFHGYGSTPERMEKLFPHLPQEFTCAAPQGFKDIGGDRGWFLLDYFLSNDLAEVMESCTRLLAWLDGIKAQHSSVSLLGFSQGMAMASSLLRLRPEQFRATVGLSGFVLDNDLLALTESFTERPPFFWGRDKGDLVINEDATGFTAEWLEENTALTARSYPGLGHWMAVQEMVDVSAFLRYYVLGTPSVR
ncbi:MULTISPECIES: phospholipase [Arthrobacter]|uniref:Phospholipase n=2 Tax=Arthrobacter TaxID=1663 RepID=A0ABU9KIB1_9MICC|nr:phospholipase [Arthrobacter sp. YJM1]MDP5226368.1 phospholipase [Arthrobacter sp. YJM1]